MRWITRSLVCLCHVVLNRASDWLTVRYTTPAATRYFVEQEREDSGNEVAHMLDFITMGFHPPEKNSINL